MSGVTFILEDGHGARARRVQTELELLRVDVEESFGSPSQDLREGSVSGDACRDFYAAVRHESWPRSGGQVRIQLDCQDVSNANFADRAVARVLGDRRLPFTKVVGSI